MLYNVKGWRDLKILGVLNGYSFIMKRLKIIDGVKIGRYGLVMR